jgi:NADH:ubiquinone oxidoreductase subunit 6 (subunit J)
MSHIPSIIFYGVSALLVLSAIGVVTLRNIFYSAIMLVVSLTLVAFLFVLMGADFLGAAQVLVYVGGIMIIMLFVIMLSQQPKDVYQSQTNDQWLAAGLITITIGISLVRGFRVFLHPMEASHVMLPTSAPMGRLLLGDMLLPFEVVSLILLAALVGAVFFGTDKQS